MDLPDYVPRRRGKKIAKSTGWRWAKVGVRGIRLELLMCGGVAHTSQEKLQEFFEKITAVANGEPVPGRTAKQRNREIAAAEAEADRLLRPRRTLTRRKPARSCFGDDDRTG